MEVGIYIYPGRLVIEFYEGRSAATAASKENGAVFQGHTVSVSRMKPWHNKILGELIEWIDPDAFYDDTPDAKCIPIDPCPSFSASGDPVESGDCPSIASKIALMKIMAQLRYLNTSQLHAVFEITHARRVTLDSRVDPSLLTAETEPWLTPLARKLLKTLPALNKRRKRDRTAPRETRFRIKRDHVREVVENCKVAWLENINTELRECDKSLFEGTSFRSIP
ncbi:unnamed protein product [Schistocephalus solidus]|uniref:RRM domain-containing protein n=1 Tax=Schistocephalus solidus TaxID=70667 RepID=A0A183T9B5_SCHSO|nr:unnamed protein product [Schistocephalus solidus]